MNNEKESITTAPNQLRSGWGSMGEEVPEGGYKAGQVVTIAGCNPNASVVPSAQLAQNLVKFGHGDGQQGRVQDIFMVEHVYTDGVHQFKYASTVGWCWNAGLGNTENWLPVESMSAAQQRVLELAAKNPLFPQPLHKRLWSLVNMPQATVRGVSVSAGASGKRARLLHHDGRVEVAQFDDKGSVLLPHGFNGQVVIDHENAKLRPKQVPYRNPQRALKKLMAAGKRKSRG